MTITARIRDERAADDALPSLLSVARVTAFVGGPLFLVGVVLHPARDGIGVHAAGAMYGITHALQAFSLLLQAVCLVSVYAAGVPRFGRRGLSAFFSALVGTLLWFGLIAIDGSRNPVVARYAPALVHTPADFEPGVAMIILPALVLFPIGYVLLARLLVGSARTLPSSRRSRSRARCPTRSASCCSAARVWRSARRRRHDSAPASGEAR